MIPARGDEVWVVRSDGDVDCVYVNRRWPALGATSSFDVQRADRITFPMEYRYVYFENDERVTWARADDLAALATVRLLQGL